MRVARVGVEARGLGAEADGDLRQLRGIGDPPRLGAVREIAVREHDHGRHVLDRDPAGLERDPEAVARRAGRQDGHGRLGVPAEERLEQVGLLGLRRQPRRGAATLDVDDDERQLDHGREADRLRLERHARARGRGDRETAGVGRADRGGDRRDLVLGLEGDDAVLLQHRQLVQDVGGGRDRIAALEERQPRLPGRGHEAEGERRVAREVAVQPRREARRRDVVADLEGLRRVAVGVARLQGALVGLGEQRLGRELLREPALGRLRRAVVEPVAHAEREEVLAAIHALGVEAEAGQRRARELAEREREDAIALERPVLERVRRELRLLEVDRLEVVGVDDQDPAGLEVRQVDLERGGVHGHERVDGVARRRDVACAELDLEPAHAREGTRGRADLGREIGERREVVAEQGRRARELTARDLHAVARVPGEADDGAVEGLATASRYRCARGHALLFCWKK